MDRMARCLLVLALALALGTPAVAELTPWDQAKVSALGKQLNEGTKALYDTFYKQPVPGAASGQAQDYRRLKQELRRLRSEAKEFSDALGRGEGREDTLDIYENLMTEVRDAREMAARVFTTKDVQERASAVRQVLNEISPYYDPDAKPLQPATR